MNHDPEPYQRFFPRHRTSYPTWGQLSQLALALRTARLRVMQAKSQTEAEFWKRQVGTLRQELRRNAQAFGMSEQEAARFLDASAAPKG